jgi:hypothetical protein
MRPSCCFVIVASVALLAATSRGDEVLRVCTDFPGGAAHVLAIDQAARKIQFEVPEFPNGGLRSWWYFRVTGVRPGETLTLELNYGRSRAERAVYSLDRRSWHFTAPCRQETDDSPSVYTQRVDGSSAWFAWYVPYLPADAEALIQQAVQSSPHAKRFELCRSEEDRPVWGVRIVEANVPEQDVRAIWIQARQHAWEPGGSWTAHGLVDWLLSDDRRAQALRRRAAVSIVPIMDVDSVAKGAGGKWQKPHDHNRDWSDRPYWNAVRAAMAEAKRLDDAGQLDLFLDLHDPSWHGAFEFWCNPYPTMQGVRRENTDRFLRACKAEIVGPLPFHEEVYSPYPITTPTAGNWSSTRTRETVVGGTCEIGVGPPDGFEGQPPRHQIVAGGQLGLAIERWLPARSRQ